ncbi:polysaccharide biosynthesis/export family protein [Paraburkholderia fungorum]|uniref:polysaccharide biosynthesis/export family protein n=1 Tax=Paraburkholderia fungorum TaxID=134537 RepID=UPI003CD0D49A
MSIKDEYSRGVAAALKEKATRAVILAILGSALAGCAAAPGMRMRPAPTIAAAPASSNEPEQQLPVPLTTIDLALIAKLRQTHSGSNGELAPLEDTGGAYRIGIGDVLQITVWDHPEIAAALGAQPTSTTRPADAPSGFVVDNKGDLVFPFAGKIHVAGSSPDEVQAVLARSFEKSFRDPQVTVRIASFRSQRVYIEGEVHAPGTQVINDIPMNLTDAISRAGGFAASADQGHVELQRNSVHYVIDMSGTHVATSELAKIVLRNGDVLRIPPRDEFGVFVMGEVNKPVTAVPKTTGALTLSEALSQAGSLSSTSADAGQVYVIRGSLDGKPEVFHLDASSPVAMVLANEFPLKSKDIVYVDGNGLVRFSRVLSLLLPALNAGLTAAIVTK